MQINSANISPQTNQLIRNNPDNQQQKRIAEQLYERQTQQDEQRPQQVNRLDVNENAIAVLERENQQRQNASTSNKNTDNNNTSFDNPSKQNSTAIAAYQSVSNIERRDNVQQLLGVDLFA